VPTPAFGPLDFLPRLERRLTMNVRINIKNHERGLFFRKGNFAGILPPGRHLNLAGLWNADTHVCVYSTLITRLEHPLLDTFLHEPAFQAQALTVNLSDHERALVWKDRRLACILGPGRHAFWKTPYELKVETFDVHNVKFTHPSLAAVMQHPDVLKFFDGVQVTDHELVLLYQDGVLIDRLKEGLHVFWKGAGKIAWRAVDLREQVAEVAGQEIMTADKVTLRVNLIVTYAVTDPVRAVTAAADYAQALYREAQLVLRSAVGTRTLDALLADKEATGGEVRHGLIARTEQLGLTVKSVGLRDIVLPGEMKTILNQVIQATKEAEANLIKRREETAAARSQANTAKLLAENPILVRLKELEALQAILANTRATFVLGGGDIAGQIKSLVAAEKE
jgi:regulator of protease activity HflC (stomatin/prohibitin superfamily)